MNSEMGAIYRIKYIPKAGYIIQERCKVKAGIIFKKEKHKWFNLSCRGLVSEWASQLLPLPIAVYGTYEEALTIVTEVISIGVYIPTRDINRNKPPQGGSGVPSKQV